MKPQLRSTRNRPSSKPFSGRKHSPFKSLHSSDKREFDDRGSEKREGQKRDDPKREFKKSGFKKRGFGKSNFEKPKFGKPRFDDRGPEKRDGQERDNPKRDFKKSGFKKRDFGKSNFEKPKFGKPRFDDRAPEERDGQERDNPKRDFKKSGFKKRDFGKSSFEKPKFDKPRLNKSSHANFRTKRDEKDRSEKRVSEKRDGNNVLIWGFHAARAAWLNPKRKCLRLWLSESGQKTFEETIAAARENLLKRPDTKHSDRAEMDRLTPPGSVHQGILLEVEPLHEPSLHDLITIDNPPDCLIMLDQVTDPHNIGAILRSAAALGAGGVILTERNAPSMTGVLAKSASGAADHIPQVHVVNLSRALDELREAGYWSVGLAEEGEKDLAACDLSGRTVLVLGAEGEGLRQLTRKKCDQLARLPTHGPIGSLNVSNAAAVALYEVQRQKRKL